MSRYIDADKLIEEIKKRIKAAIEWGKSAETEEIKIRAEQSIATFCEASLTAKKLSTADVRENVKGEWIEDNPREKSMMWRCSVCGRIAYYPTIGERKNYKKHCGYNYCPNCGADMRGES